MGALARGTRALLLLLAALGGCTRAAPDSIRFGLPTAPVTLDPRYATDAVSARLVRLLHRGLVDFDAAARPQADLASWQQLSPTDYRFTLVTDTRFSDGRALTAADVVATYAAVRDPAHGSPLRARLDNVSVVRAVNATTIDFVLRQPDPLFPGVLTLGILAAADAARPRDAWQVSNGAFMRVAARADGSVRLCRRRDGAWVDFVVVKDANVRALKLLSGELDLMQGNIPPEVYDWLATRPGLRAQQTAGTTFSYLGFNLTATALANRAVRAAIAHAIDRVAITAYVFRGQARPAATLLPPSHWAAAPDLAVPAYDRERARTLLHAAGYDDEHRLQLHYKTSADSFRLRLATILQAQLAAVGIDLQIESLDWATLYADIAAGRVEVYGLSWVGLQLPDIFRQAFHSSALPPHGLNRARYQVVEVDRLIEAAEHSTDSARRRQLYHAIERRLLYDFPYVPLWFEDQTVVMRDVIEGYHTDADGNFDALADTRRVSAHGAD